jgi:hypothetical protein
MFRLSLVAVLISALLACGDTQDDTDVPAAKALPEGLTAFNDPKAPMHTAYPQEQTAHTSACNDKGCTYVFGLPGEDGAPRDDASVTFFFPEDTKDLITLRKTYVDGEAGAFATHDAWIRSDTSGGNAAQPWLKETTPFTDGNQILGRIMLGDAPRGHFVVTEVISRPDLERARPILAAVYTHLTFPDAN